jgi:hypothetical protein
MKLNSILGCALAAGLMAFAADKAQAVVISNQLYIPFNLKLKGTYNDAGKMKKSSFTSKNALTDAGFNGKVTLALGPGTGENTFDVYVIQNNGKNSNVIADLSTNGVMSVEPSGIVFTDKGNTHTEAGTVSVFLDTANAPLFTSDDDFELDGLYTFKFTDNGNGKVNSSFKATSLSGEGFIGDIDESAALEGSASGSGSGTIEE